MTLGVASSPPRISRPERRTLVDAEARVRGSITFGQDIRIAGELRAAILRSREPSAILRGIDTSRAAAVHGVAGVFTGRDLARRLGRPITFGPIFRDQPALALDREHDVVRVQRGSCALDGRRRKRALDLATP